MIAEASQNLLTNWMSPEMEFQDHQRPVGAMGARWFSVLETTSLPKVGGSNPLPVAAVQFTFVELLRFFFLKKKKIEKIPFILSQMQRNTAC